MRLLVVNAGSSSLKLSALDEGDALIAERTLARWDGDDRPIGEFAAGAGAIDAVGHRVVHGGLAFTGPAVVDDAVLAQLGELVALAPLHQPRAIGAIGAARRVLPGATHVACFDTAFHTTLPPAAHVYALPAAWRERWPLRRYGFHGLSHSYASRRVAELAGGAVDDLRLVTCHLGAGASLCAVRGGRSVDTTMGFTPLEGLVMATRSGSVDPGLLLWLQEHVGMPAQELAATLEHRAGLLGLAGSADMQVVLARAQAGDQPASLALAVYLHRLRSGIAAMTAAMGGLDVLVFTGGVGEHAPAVRAAACQGLAFLGVHLDPLANEDEPDSGKPDRDISADGAPVRTLVIEAREDLQIAHETRQVLAGA